MKSTPLYPNPTTRGQLTKSGELKRHYRQSIPPFSSLTRVLHELSKNIYSTRLTLTLSLWNLNDTRSQPQVYLCWSKNGVFGGPAREAGKHQKHLLGGGFSGFSSLLCAHHMSNSVGSMCPLSLVTDKRRPARWASWWPRVSRIPAGLCQSQARSKGPLWPHSRNYSTKRDSEVVCL